MKNKTFTAIIIDDEEDGRTVLQSLLGSHCPEIKIDKLCNTALEGLEAIKTSKPDIVFLDINMPNMNGFGLLDQLENKDFHLIFVTAYSHYAIKAIKYAALDYILKPIDAEELEQTVKKCIQLGSEFNHKKINHFIQNLGNEEIERIVLPVRDGYIFVEIKDIVRCEADSNYTRIFISNKEEHIVCKTLKDFEAQLSNHRFFRIHKSHLINLNYIKKYTKGDGGSVTMKDNTSLDVSRRNKEEFLRHLEL